jgi:hypothetical protein
MFIAATAGIGLTSLWALFSNQKRLGRDAKQPVLPARDSRLNAFNLFQLFACASLAAINFAVNVRGSSLGTQPCSKLVNGQAIVCDAEPIDDVITSGFLTVSSFDV